VQAVPTASSPTWHYTNHNFWHEANESLYFKNVQASGARWVAIGNVVAFYVLVAIFATNALVATAAKCPSAVFGRRAIAGEKHTTHIARLTSMVEGGK
jgi:hypothetical protein